MQKAAADTKEKFIITAGVQPGQRESLRLLSPYGCIMKIILLLWPSDRQLLAESELQMLRKSAVEIPDVHDFTKLLWLDLNVKTYYEYVNRHKSQVKHCYQLFNGVMVGQVKKILLTEGCLTPELQPELDPTDEQIDRHDDSKFEFVETVTYAQRWYPSNQLGQPDEEAWQRGLQLHYSRNEHHPQYWQGRPMTWRYLLESVYDMSAMELDRRFFGTVPKDCASQLLQFQPVHLDRYCCTGQRGLICRLLAVAIEQVQSLQEHLD